LYSLLQRIPKSEPIWLASVNVALSNYFLRQSEWRLALGSMDQLLELIPTACEYEVNTKFRHVPYDRQHVLSVLMSAYRCEVLSRQGRTLMHIGALPEAEERFGTAKMDWIGLNQAGPISPDLEDVPIVQIIPPLLDVNQGLLYFANGTYEQALGCFKRATDLLRTTQGTTTTTLAPKYRMEDWVGPNVAAPEAPHALFTECINNMALSALYTCRMNEAVKLMEGLVREDPTAFLTERLAFNLCTLYELGYDLAASARKKRVLLLIGKRFFLHDVGPESFRVT
jgi:tetratricopeptide (TPR) repeat protein